MNRENAEENIVDFIRLEGEKFSEKRTEREKVIIRTSIISILANVFLAGFKAAVGIISNSVAIITDAVNNLSDAASSIITITGTRLARKPADRKHPFGHGRIEYLSAMLISLIVLYAGVTAFVESVKKIVSPQTPDYTAPSLIIIAVAVAVKIVLGLFVKKRGKKVDSDLLVGSGQDALLDSIISASTLAAAGIYLLWGISLEAWLGAAISLFIVKSGVEMLSRPISRILGGRAEAELAGKIKETVLSFPEISGVYDLVLHDYGPGRWNGSLHIEIPDTLHAKEVDKLIRSVTVKVYIEHNVILTAVGVYSVNTTDPEAISARERAEKAALRGEYIVQVHGFYLDDEEMTVRMDIVVSFDAPDRSEAFSDAVAAVQREFPGYRILAAMDSDF